MQNFLRTTIEWEEQFLKHLRFCNFILLEDSWTLTSASVWSLLSYHTSCIIEKTSLCALERLKGNIWSNIATSSFFSVIYPFIYLPACLPVCLSILISMKIPLTFWIPWKGTPEIFRFKSLHWDLISKWLGRPVLIKLGVIKLDKFMKLVIGIYL